MNTVEVVKNDITELDTDCIVNPTNTGLKEGGGVSGAIFSKAGYEKLRDACDKIGKCPVGDVVITDGFDLKQKYIIHAVGPTWQGGGRNEASLLASCYKKALNMARMHGCKSIGFPLISSGLHGYPQEAAWDVAINSVHTYFTFMPNVSLKVIFAVVNDEALEYGKKVIEKYFPPVRKDLTGFDMEDFLRALQRILSMVDPGDPLAVQLGKNLLQNMIALEKVSDKPHVYTIELMEAALEEFSYLLEHADDFCSYDFEDSQKSKNMRRRLLVTIRPHC